MKLSLKKSRSKRSSSGKEVVASPEASLLVKELSATFKVFDKDGDGRISKAELGVVLRSLGDDMSDDELDEVIVKVDGDGDGFIHLQEFIGFHTGRTGSGDASVSRTSSKRSDGGGSDEECALQAAFEVFDVDKNGFISAEELQRVMWSLGDKTASLAECRGMINSVDQDGDNMVDFNEFQCLMAGAVLCEGPI